MTKFKVGLLVGAVGAAVLLKQECVKQVLKKISK